MSKKHRETIQIQPSDSCEQPENKIHPGGFGKFWIDYVRPSHHILDVLFLIVNPDFWRVITSEHTEFFNPKYFIRYATDEDWIESNSEAIATCVLVGISLFGFKLLDVVMALIFRQHMSEVWKFKAAESAVIVFATTFAFVTGQMILVAQVVLTMRNAFMLPFTLFPSWESWTTKWKIWCIASWVCIGFTFMLIMFSWMMILMWVSPSVQEVLGANLYLYSILIPGVLLFCVFRIVHMMETLEKKRLVILSENPKQFSGTPESSPTNSVSTQPDSPETRRSITLAVSTKEVNAGQEKKSSSSNKQSKSSQKNKKPDRSSSKSKTTKTKTASTTTGATKTRKAIPSATSQGDAQTKPQRRVHITIKEKAPSPTESKKSATIATQTDPLDMV